MKGEPWTHQVAPKKLHMGCGQTFLEGWINCDGSLSARLATLPRPLLQVARATGLVDERTFDFIRFLRAHDVVPVDVLRRWPFADQSIDLIYTSHMIDCFAEQQIRHFFRECLRVLKSGGALRLAGLDLAREVQTYLEDRDSRRLVSMISPPRSEAIGLRQKLRDLVVPAKHYLAHHDAGSITAMLAEVGFVDIDTLSPGHSTIEGIEPVNLHQRQGESMYIEARKP
ncbi:MAG: hypothetical protein ER33_00500 [Cyanobium sp. CACIAM 14]|nr:MAG: hypothetical protein ER33_00500 [Cyanobium sp. CACIAM 14]